MEMPFQRDVNDKTPLLFEKRGFVYNGCYLNPMEQNESFSFGFIHRPLT
jgi:hypothetical protein